MSSAAEIRQDESPVRESAEMSTASIWLSGTTTDTGLVLQADAAARVTNVATILRIYDSIEDRQTASHPSIYRIHTCAVVILSEAKDLGPVRHDRGPSPSAQDDTCISGTVH